MNKQTLRKKQHKIQPPSIHLMELINDKLLRKILTFLTVVELCALIRVCKKWKNMIEKDIFIFEEVNLEILPSNVKVFNLLRIFGSEKQIKLLKLPKNASSSDTSFLLMCVPQTLNTLNICNINLEFSKVFTKKFENLKSLSLGNITKRTKGFDETDLKALIYLASSIQDLSLDDTPITDQTLIFILSRLNNIKTLTITNAPQIGNVVLQSIGKQCSNIKQLKIGASPLKYNMLINKEGFQYMALSNIQLEELQLEYLANVGDECIKLIGERFKNSLIKLSVIRNCFERCSKITDSAFEYLNQCLKLQQLQITYSRKFRDRIHIEISNLHNLTHLSLKNCPIYVDLSILAQKCPLLVEVNLSGDSWVCQVAIQGLSKHQGLKFKNNQKKNLKNNRVLHLGHFEHGDLNCEKLLQENPTEGLFLEALFKKTWSFPKLGLLYLQANCSLTYWLDVRLNIIRPHLFIKYTKEEKNIHRLNI